MLENTSTTSWLYEFHTQMDVPLVYYLYVVYNWSVCVYRRHAACLMDSDDVECRTNEMWFMQ